MIRMLPLAALLLLGTPAAAQTLQGDNCDRWLLLIQPAPDRRTLQLHVTNPHPFGMAVHAIVRPVEGLTVTPPVPTWVSPRTNRVLTLGQASTVPVTGALLQRLAAAVSVRCASS